MLPYFPQPLGDDAARRVLAMLAARGVSIGRETLPDGRVVIHLVKEEDRLRRAFVSPLNLWHQHPEATVALAAELALRAYNAHSDLDGWLRLAGHGADREELRGSELRRALLERQEAGELALIFGAMLGVNWDILIEAALCG